MLNIPKIKTIDLELDDELAPKTVSSFLKCLPLDVAINSWGEELYTNETTITVGLENAKPLVDLMDVAIGQQEKQYVFFLGPHL